MGGHSLKSHHGFEARHHPMKPRRGSLSPSVRYSTRHLLKPLHPIRDLGLDPPQIGHDRRRTLMHALLVLHLAVAVEREIVARGGDVGLGHAEALRRTRPRAL